MPAKKKKSNRNYILLTILLLALCCAAVMWSTRQIPQAKTVKHTEVTTQTQKAKQKSRPTAPQETSKQSKITSGSIELPAHIANNDSIIYNRIGRYTLQYSPYYRSALWVAYKLTLSDIKGNAGRSSGFTQDKELLKRGYMIAQNSDYKNSGYDKGHLLPSADRQGSEQENKATFILSNCPPQLPALNRRTWKLLEEKLRRDCNIYDTIYIVTGTVFKPMAKSLSKSKIRIASYFFKATLFRKGDTFTPLGYLMPHDEKISGNPEKYKVSLDSIEHITGLKLFPAVTNF